MKVNIIRTFIALALSALVAYGFFTMNTSENKILLSAGSFLFLSITLIATLGINFELPRTTTNIRAISGIFFVIALTSNLVFGFIPFTVPLYVIVNGILLLCHMLISYTIFNAKQ
ncbi:MAG: hypothetical protein EB023_12910 [Flavobacteriia bacterium]|nr:hypothetical protein [Flavobacteriia bacterium]